MASAQVETSTSPQVLQQQLPPDTVKSGEDDAQTLDKILRPHLRLETAEEPTRPAKGLRKLGASFSKPGERKPVDEDSTNKVRVKHSHHYLLKTDSVI